MHPYIINTFDGLRTVLNRQDILPAALMSKEVSRYDRMGVQTTRKGGALVALSNGQHNAPFFLISTTIAHCLRFKVTIKGEWLTDIEESVGRDDDSRVDEVRPHPAAAESKERSDSMVPSQRPLTGHPTRRTAKIPWLVAAIKILLPALDAIEGRLLVKHRQQSLV